MVKQIFSNMLQNIIDYISDFNLDLLLNLFNN